MPRRRCSKCGAAPKEGLMKCSRCNGATGVYCSVECQKAHWKAHKPMCIPLHKDEVWGVRILDNRFSSFSRQFENVLLRTSHPIFTQGELCPVTARCRFPLLIYSESIQGEERARDNNQPAGYLRMRTEDGALPYHWQANQRGTCYVVHKDRQHLTKEAIEIVYEYHSHLLDLVDVDFTSEDSDAPWLDGQSPERLREFAVEYCEKETSRGREGFDFFP